MYFSKVSRTTTPTPGEIRPIYEAESPDELALVDAAYAYNIKLLNRYNFNNILKADLVRHLFAKYSSLRT